MDNAQYPPNQITRSNLLDACRDTARAVPASRHDGARFRDMFGHLLTPMSVKQLPAPVQDAGRQGKRGCVIWSVWKLGLFRRGIVARGHLPRHRCPRPYSVIAPLRFPKGSPCSQQIRTDHDPTTPRGRWQIQVKMRWLLEAACCPFFLSLRSYVPRSQNDDIIEPEVDDCAVSKKATERISQKDWQVARQFSSNPPEMFSRRSCF